MRRKKLKSITPFDYTTIFLLCLLGFFTLYPFWWIFATSIAEPVWLSTHSVSFFPSKTSFVAYSYILGESKLWNSMLNSFIYAFFSTIVTTLTCSLFAYPLTLPGFKLRKFLNIFILIPIFVSAGMIPVYLNMLNLGLVGSRLSLIIPSAMSTTYIILFRTNFKSLGGDLREAALIDGANELQIFFKIIIPVAKVMFLIIAMYAFVGSWNSFMPPLLYLNDDRKMPLAIYLRDLLISQTMDTQELTLSTGGEFYRTIASKGGGIGMRLAIKNGVIIVSSLPIIMIYPFIQRYFVQGVMVGSVKG